MSSSAEVQGMRPAYVGCWSREGWLLNYHSRVQNLEQVPTSLRCYRIFRQRLLGGSNSSWPGYGGGWQWATSIPLLPQAGTEDWQSSGAGLLPALRPCSLWASIACQGTTVREGGRQGCGCLPLTRIHSNKVRKDTLTHEQVPSFLIPKGCLCSDPRISLSLSSILGREREEVLSKANIQKECDQQTFPYKEKHLL